MSPLLFFLPARLHASRAHLAVPFSFAAVAPPSDFAVVRLDVLSAPILDMGPTGFDGPALVAYFLINWYSTAIHWAALPSLVVA